MGKKPKVSIIMSVYNEEEFLCECIDGINAQTYPDYEVIVIDDGSTDKTSDILYSWSTENDRVRIITRKNEGLTSALNLAISLARGEYLARHDADDISAPNRLEEQVEFLDRHSDVVLVGSHVVEFEKKQSLITLYMPPDSHEFIVNTLHKGENPLVHGSIMLRKSAFKKLSEGYRFRYSQDYDLYLRMLHLGDLRIIPEVLYALRSHSSRIGVKARVFRRPIRKLIMQMNGLIPWDPKSESIIANYKGDKPLWQVLEERLTQTLSIPSKKKMYAQHFMTMIGDNLEKDRRINALTSALNAIKNCPVWPKSWLSLPYALIGILLPRSIIAQWRSRSTLGKYRTPCQVNSLEEVFNKSENS